MCDLLVLGAGQLGCRVARKWQKQNSKSRIVLKFRSHNQERIDNLSKEGFSVISKEKGESCKSPFIVYCAPPTGNQDYAG